MLFTSLPLFSPFDNSTLTSLSLSFPAIPLPHVPPAHKTQRDAQRNETERNAVSNFIISFSALTGTPINGAIVTNNGGPADASAFTGAAVFSGGALSLSVYSL